MRIFLRTLLLLALLLTCSATTLSFAQGGAPAYARQRTGARDGDWNGDFREGRQFAGHFSGYSPYQPVVAGSWYARPYPYHFDYYRQRYGSPLQGYSAPLQGYSAPPQTRGCPCAEAPTPY